MQKWEYMVANYQGGWLVYLKGGPNESHSTSLALTHAAGPVGLSEGLNKAGNDGWELILKTENEMVFKRPKP